MRKLLLLIILLTYIAVPVSAMDFSAPTAPDGAQEYMPENTDSFAQGLWYVVKAAIGKLQPSIAEAAGVCLSLFAVVLLVSVMQSFSEGTRKTSQLVGTLGIGILLFYPTNSLITLGAETIKELSDYGKLLLPVLTGALAAQGGATSSAALYTGTAIFDAVLSSVISKLIVPILYVYLCLCVANSAAGETLLKKIRDFVKWAMTWCLKIVLYVFTGYISITGVVSGTADAATIKAAKLAISGAVPVVGSILSDASETILVSAGVLKSAVGVYGLLAILAVWIGPFFQIGIQYLLLKITSAVCGVIGTKDSAALIEDFSGAMGMLLAMTGTVCLLLLISTVCFMKGVS
jgi:stage III sporulation protein AE